MNNDNAKRGEQIRWVATVLSDEIEIAKQRAFASDQIADISRLHSDVDKLMQIVALLSQYAEHAYKIELNWPKLGSGDSTKSTDLPF